MICSLCEDNIEARDVLRFKIGILNYTLCRVCWNGICDGVEEVLGPCKHCYKMPYTPDEDEE